MKRQGRIEREYYGVARHNPWPNESDDPQFIAPIKTIDEAQEYQRQWGGVIVRIKSVKSWEPVADNLQRKPL